MKDTFIQLVAQTDSIESRFHHGSRAADPRLNFEHEDAIWDVPEFKVWLEELKFELQDIVDRTNDKYAIDTLAAANAKFNGWSDKSKFELLKNRIGIMAKNVDKYYVSENGSENEIEIPKKKAPKVFISHASIDKEYVKKLVDLLAYIGLTEDQIFCTSYPGYDIQIGKDICETLWQQFQEFELFVIFVHSHNYYQRPVCLNEMGAAWVLKSEYISFLLPGFKFDEMVGVVSGREISIKLDNEEREVKDKLNQLYNKLIDKFSLPKSKQTLWETHRDNFIQNVNMIVPQGTEEPPRDTDLEMMEKGYYIKKSEREAGKNIKYCPACYTKHGKLFPIIAGKIWGDTFCVNCKTHYNS